MALAVAVVPLGCWAIAARPCRRWGQVTSTAQRCWRRHNFTTSAAPADAVHIRPAQLQDCLQLSKIEQLCEPLGGAGWTLEQLQDELSNPLARVLVACSSLQQLPDSGSCLQAGRSDDAELLGFVCGWLVAGEIQVLELAVRPQQQGRGLGRRLLAALLQQCSCDSSSAFLEVRASNAAAQALYHKLGFEEVGRRRRYYPDGQDALLMQRPAAALLAER